MVLSLSPPFLLVLIAGLLLVASSLMRSASVVLDLIGELLSALFANFRALAVIGLIIIGLIFTIFLGIGQTPTAVG